MIEAVPYRSRDLIAPYLHRKFGAPDLDDVIPILQCQAPSARESGKSRRACREQSGAGRPRPSRFLLLSWHLQPHFDHFPLSWRRCSRTTTSPSPLLSGSSTIPNANTDKNPLSLTQLLHEARFRFPHVVMKWTTPGVVGLW